MSNRPRSSPVIKEATTVGRATAKALGCTEDKIELMNGIEAFVKGSTGFFGCF